MAAPYETTLPGPPTPTPAVPRVERTIAIARFGLAVAGLVLIWVDPSQAAPGRSTATGLFAAYALLAIGCGAMLRFAPASPWAFAVATHLVDTAMAAAITLLADAPGSPFFLVLNFPVITAAYRWGLVETLCTALLSMSLLAIESPWVTAPAVAATPTMTASATAAARPFVRGAYLCALALLVGALAEQEHRQRRETALVARLLGQIRLGLPVADSLDAALAALSDAFNARRVIIVMQQLRTGRTFVHQWPHWSQAVQGGSVTRHTGGTAPAPGSPAVARPGSSTPRPANGPRELPGHDGDDYFFTIAGTAAHGWRPPFRKSRYNVVAVDGQGAALRSTWVELPASIAATLASRRLLVASANFDERWGVRLFLLNPAVTLARAATADRLRRLVAAVGPALFAQFEATRVGTRASQAERARIVRDLHDGPVQSLLGVELELAVLRRRAASQAPALADDLGRFHDTLKHEVIGLREVFEGVRAGAGANRPIQQDLADVVTRFAIYTGLDARYSGDHQPVVLAPGIRRELLRITHEALANIRKHSGARRVVVRTEALDGALRLHIEDSGRGFPWAGQRSDAELRNNHDGPWTILERAATIHATLSITSRPGSGAALDLLVPLSSPASRATLAAAPTPGVPA